MYCHCSKLNKKQFYFFLHVNRLIIDTIFWPWFIYKSSGFHPLKLINILSDIYITLVWAFSTELHSLLLVNVLMFVWHLLNRPGKFTLPRIVVVRYITVWTDGRECTCTCVWYTRSRLYSLNVTTRYVIWFLSATNDNIAFILKVEECNPFVLISEPRFHITTI